jgi:origin recognition complex subunit 1
MRLGTPQQIFREIVDQLPVPGKRVSNGQLQDYLAHFFLKPKRQDPVIVLLVDEVDCLMTANQAVLYKVFDWLGMPKARLVLAAISNTMDLPERLLPRVASRFHIERVDFEPYNRSQLHEILCSRLKAVDGVDAFSSDVVLKLCAARVAAGSGDVRKALQVCRCAVAACLQKSQEERGPVKIADLEAAEQELLFANPVTKAILSQSVLTRRFLAALALELMHAEHGDAVFLHQVSARFKKLLAVTAVDGQRCSMEVDQATAAEMMVDSEVEDMAKYLSSRLGAMSILRVSSLTSGLQAISLGSLDVEELAVALLKVEEDPTVQELLEAGRFF